MSIGPDLKEVLTEVGIKVEIFDSEGVSVGTEYMDYEINRQVTKPFIREFFLEGFVHYETLIKAGYYVVFIVDGRRFLVMNSTPEVFENEIIKYDVILYKTNEQVDIYRKSGVVRDSNYDRVDNYTLVKSGVYVLLTERFYGTNLITPKHVDELLELEISKDQMFIPKAIDIHPKDRVVVSPSEKYLVSFIETRQFDNVWVCTLEEDAGGGN